MSEKAKGLTYSTFTNASDTAELLHSARSVYKKIMKANKNKFYRKHFNQYVKLLDTLIHRLTTEPSMTSSIRYEGEGIVENANRVYDAFFEAKNSVSSFPPKESPKSVSKRPEIIPSLLQTRKCLRRLTVVKNQFLLHLDLSEHSKTWRELVQSIHDFSSPVACSGKQLQDAESLIQRVRMKLGRVIKAVPEIVTPIPHRTERRGHSRGKLVAKHDGQVGMGYGEVEGGSVDYYSREAQDKNLREQLEEAAARFHNTGSKSRR